MAWTAWTDLGRVRGLGKTFTINQSWPGPGAPQQVAAAQFPSGRTRTSSVNIVNTDGAWHAVDRSGAFEWIEWIEERQFVKSIDQWAYPEKSNFQLKLESVSYCPRLQPNLRPLCKLEAQWTNVNVIEEGKWWPKTWIMWSKELSCHFGTTFG